MLTPQFRVALIRGSYNAVGSGLFVALMTWATTDSLKTIAIAAGTAALGVLGFRGGLEGAIDSSRAAQGRVSAADVGQQAPARRRTVMDPDGDGVMDP